MMPDIRPTATSLDIACAETPAPPCAIVIFGASGDLVHRKLVPSLLELQRRDLLNEQFCLLGCGRSPLTDESFRDNLRQPLSKSATHLSEKELNDFFTKVYYVSGDYDGPDLYQSLKMRLSELDRIHRFSPKIIFYLSVPPFLYETIAEQLRHNDLSGDSTTENGWQSSLVIEKPFGRDLDSAIELNQTLGQCFQESQLYRIDHYMGKETVQNILMFRFANAIFEPVWNRNYIDHIQITIAETLGVEHRGSYYDKSGALRDMFQNHMLQMLSLVAMEPPVSFEADAVRDEKIKLLRSIRPIASEEEVERFFVRAQYAQGNDMAGYRQEKGVDSRSNVETFVAAKLFIDNWRWKDVPFYLRTGKRLSAKTTEIAVTFKQVPHSLFTSAGLETIPPNVLIMKIQPEEGLSLSFQAKRPGSKLCMGTLTMDFSYETVFGIQMPEAYQRLLLDCMVADQTLFMRFDTLETTWRLLEPVLNAWEKNDDPLFLYSAGVSSFPEADRLIRSDGRRWRPL